MSPTTWPLVWLGFTAVTIFDPFPVASKSSRYWFLKKTGKLLVSGTRRVEVSVIAHGGQRANLS